MSTTKFIASEEWKNTNNPELDTYLKRATADPKIQKIKRASLVKLVGGCTGPIKVLDVGCGNGLDAIAIATMVPSSSEVTGIDFNSQLISVAKSELDEFQKIHPTSTTVQFIVADIATTKLDFPDGYFDCVRADRVIQHVTEPTVVLNEMKRVLKPGGKMVICEGDHRSILMFNEDPIIKEVFQMICAFGAAAVRFPKIGTELGGLYKKMGMQSVEVDADAVLITSPTQLDPDLKRLSAMLQMGVDKGLLAADKREAYLEKLRTSEEFTCMQTSLLFTVSGVKGE